MASDVTFETKCWENDWRLMLQTDHLAEMINNCGYAFAEKILFINNVNNPEKVKKYAEKAVKNGIIDKYVMVEEYADEVLKHFDIEKDDFAGGYYYSISELVSIYLCRTKYLLHFSSDSYIPNEYKAVEWIDPAIKLMEETPEFIAANPVWNYHFDEGENESYDETDEFWISKGFSDQCYLINTDVFKNRIYNCRHEAAEKYPKYGGELFEKRVFSYMMTEGKSRLTSKKLSYISCNVTKKQIIKEMIGKRI